MSPSCLKYSETLEGVKKDTLRCDEDITEYGDDIVYMWTFFEVYCSPMEYKVLHPYEKAWIINNGTWDF